MSVLDRSALEASPLADLHAIASELSIDGYRRLRRADLIGAILDKQEGGEGRSGSATTARRARRPAAKAVAAVEAVEAVEAVAGEEAEEAEEAEEKADAEAAPSEDEEEAAPRRRRGRRGGRGRGAARDEAEPEAAKEGEAREDEAKEPEEVEETEETETEPTAPEELVEGVVELLANGSGFIRVQPPEPSDDDVYISSAQVKRCELVSGDRIAGPKRAPRRSERFASLIRIETINGRPAAELADGVRFDDLPAAFPADRLELDSDDPTLKAIESLTPFGKGSRVTIVGESRAGKTETLKKLAAALAGRDELTLSVVLAGVRPEEIADWPVAPSAAVSLAASEDARNGAIEPAIDQARRLAARGADAVVLIDTLDGSSRQLARKALAAARNIVDGGSLTVIATAPAPVGGETTVIALDAALASTGRFPALDLVASGTLRPELLVGETGAREIIRARVQATGGAA